MYKVWQGAGALVQRIMNVNLCDIGRLFRIKQENKLTVRPDSVFPNSLKGCGVILQTSRLHHVLYGIGFSLDLH